MQYVLHIFMILGDKPSRKKQDPQIKDLANNFVDYFIMQPPFYTEPKSKRAAYRWPLMALFPSLYL